MLYADEGLVIDNSWLNELYKRELADDGDGGSKDGGWKERKPDWRFSWVLIG